MGAFLVYTIKASLCLLAFYLFYKVLLSRDTFHRLNRVLLLACMALSLLIPLVHVPVPEASAVNAPMLDLEDFLLQGSYTLIQDVQEQPALNEMAVVVLVYLAGVFFFFMRMVWSIGKLMLLLRKSRVVQKTRDYTLILHREEGLSPFSWMNCIILPEKDYDEEAYTILEHEKAHIRNHHSWDLVLANVCCLFQWFNPSAWLLKQELQNVHEYEADDCVLNLGIDAKTYQMLLIKKAAGARLYSLANSFNHSSLKKRITMMLVEKSNVWARAKYLFVVPVSVLAVTAFARPEVVNLSQEMEAVTVEDLTATVSKVTEKVSATPHDFAKIVQEERKDTVYQVVDEQPEYPGGAQALLNYLSTAMKYPAAAKEKGVQGRVILQFVVTEKGKVTDINVIRSVDPELDAEATRVVASMADWQPGKLRGKAVKCRYTFPVTFKLDGSAVQPVAGKNEATVQGTVEEPVFQVVEEQPEYPGGVSALMEFLAKSIKYPEDAEKEGIQGRVIVQFVIDKDGSVMAPKVVRSVHPSIDAEAMRVVSSMPKWKPGVQRGQAVKVRYTLPLYFRTNDPKPETAAETPSESSN